MKLFYYQAAGGNFGDDLNGACWDRAWPDYRQSHAADWLVGIGSILDGRLNELPGTKLILGTGHRFTKFGMPDLRSCRLGFVRGPLTCRALGIDEYHAITDGAVLMGVDRTARATSDPRPGFMPHFHTRQRFDCARLAEMADVRLIDPSGPVDAVLEAIAQSSQLLTEAMHGAIVADAMGVPWQRVSIFNRRLEGPARVDFKWQDWGASLDLDTTCTVEYLLPWPGRGPLSRFVGNFVRERCLRKAAEAIRAAARSGCCRLSDRGLLRSKVDRIQETIQEARAEGA